MKGAVKLKREKYMSWLAFGTPEVAEIATGRKAIPDEGGHWVWEEFGVAMVQVFHSANCSVAQEGKAEPCPHGLGCGRGVADLN